MIFHNLYWHIWQNAKQKNYFAVSNPPKCIANLRTQPMHFKTNLEIYQTSFVMKEVVKKLVEIAIILID